MRIAITKGEASDRIAIVRGDGSGTAFTFPKKGPSPHDAFHIVIEGELGLTRGFWGLIASGMEPEAVGEMAKRGGHASASRAQRPDASIVELLQAERLVECFEAESWSGAADNAGIRHMAQSGWEASHVPALDLKDERLEAIRARLDDIAATWSRLGAGEELVLEWEE